jgi:hypothetical protein
MIATSLFRYDDFDGGHGRDSTSAHPTGASVLALAKSGASQKREAHIA